MNRVEFFFNGPTSHNILLYNGESLDAGDLLLSVEKTLPAVVIIYNIYSGHKTKAGLIHQINYPHYFYTFSRPDEKLLDSGIAIASKFPVVIHTNTKKPAITNRLARVLVLSIKKYQFKIDIDARFNRDGYYFALKNIPTSNRIIHTTKQINSKIILLKAPN